MIRSGTLPPDVHVVGPRIEADDRPDPKAVRRGHGLGLGDGACRYRDGEKR